MNRFNTKLGRYTGRHTRDTNCSRRVCRALLSAKPCGVKTEKNVPVSGIGIYTTVLIMYLGIIDATSRDNLQPRLSANQHAKYPSLYRRGADTNVTNRLRSRLYEWACACAVLCDCGLNEMKRNKQSWQP